MKSVIFIFALLTAFGSYANNNTNLNSESKSELILSEAQAPVMVLEIAGTLTVVGSGDGWVIVKCPGDEGRCVDIWLYPDGTYDAHFPNEGRHYICNEEPTVERDEYGNEEVTIEYQSSY
jgi:hypothetical protein